MTSDELTVSTERAIGFTWLRAGGLLSASSAAELRRVLATALSDRSRVVADLTGLVAGRSLLAIFAAAHAAGGGWPAVRLALLAPDPMRRDLAERGVAQLIPVRATLAEAVAALDQRPPVIRRRMELENEPWATGLARVLARRTCNDWGMPPRIGLGALLAASDLVADAQRRGACAMRLTVECSGESVRVAVRDWSPVEPDADDLRDVLVDSFDGRIEVTHHADGRTLSAALPISAG